MIFVNAFADGLDLVEVGFERVPPKRTGRAGCDPADFLKLYVHHDLNRIRSSRRLVAETHADDPGASAAATDLEGKIASIRKRRATLKADWETLEECGREQLSLTHPDSRLMKIAKGGAVGFNVQTAVEPKHNLITGSRCPARCPSLRAGSRRTRGRWSTGLESPVPNTCV